MDDEDLEWRAPRGKVNVQVASTWAFLIAVVAVVGALGWLAYVVLR